MRPRFWRERIEAMRANGASRSGTLARVVENALFLLAGKSVGGVLSLVYLGIATRTLGLEGFGQFALILSIAQSITGLVSFQSWQLVVRYGMAPFRLGETGLLGRLVAFCTALDIAGAILGCGIAAFSLLALGSWFGWTEQVQWEAFFFCVVMLLSIRSTPVGILRLYDRFGMGATADIVTPVVRLAGAGIVLAVGPSVTGFLYAWAAAEIATAAVYWWFAWRTARPTMRLRYFGGLARVKREHDGILGFAVITNLNSTFAIITKQFSTVLVGILLGTAAAGTYRLAFQLSQAMAKLTETLSRSIFAELTRVHFGGTEGGLAVLSKSVTRLALVAGLVIVALLLIIGEPALRFIAGPEFVGAYPVLVLLGAATALELGSVSFEPILLVSGRARLALWLRLAVCVILVVLMFILIPRWGLIGAGMATLAASGLGLVVLRIASRRVLAPDGAMNPA